MLKGQVHFQTIKLMLKNICSLINKINLLHVHVLCLFARSVVREFGEVEDRNSKCRGEIL